MKRLICVVLLFCLLPIVSIADGIDLSSLTYAQLLMLRNRLTEEIISRPEWKEVTIPSGDWVVGVDIPAGYYSIRPVTYGYIRIMDEKGSLFYNDAMKEGDYVGKIYLKQGYTIRCEDAFIFAPSKGLGF